MRKLCLSYILFLFFLVAGFSQSQAQTFDWAKKGIGESKAMKVDAHGNVYVVGSIKSALNLLNISISLFGGTDCYIAKYDAAGNLLWVKNAGGLLDDEALDICLDVYGNAYLTGTFKGRAAFGSIILNSKGGKDVFIAKCKPDGVFEWVKQCGGTSDDNGNGIFVDVYGNICVTGVFGGTSIFEGVSLAVANGKSFVIKYAANGVYQWVKQLDCNAKSISVDLNGNLIIAGSKEISLKHCAYIIKLNSAGYKIWDFCANGNDANHKYSFVKDIHVDGLGNIFATGDFNTKIVLGGITLVGANVGFTDVFCFKLNAQGALIFINKIYGNAGGSTGEGIIADLNGEIYLTGKVNGNVSLLNNLISITSSGKADLFIAKLDAYGAVLWMKNGGGSKDDCGNALDLDVVGNVLFCGSIAANASFGVNILTISILVNVEACIGKLKQPTYPMAVKSFILINADTDQDLGAIFDNDTITLSELPTTNLNIRANTYPALVGSVVLKYDQGSRTESTAPYSFFGDDNGNYKPGKLNPGSHVLVGIPYSKANGAGDRGKDLTVRFFVKIGESGCGKSLIVNAGSDQTLTLPKDSTVLNGTSTSQGGSVTYINWTKVSGPSASMFDFNTNNLVLKNLQAGTYLFRMSATDTKNFTCSDDVYVTVINAGPTQAVISFTLIDSDTDADIKEIKDKDTIRLSQLPSQNINFRANTNPTLVGSVIFKYDNTTKGENGAPYSYFGDVNGDYKPGILTAGVHTLTGTPYTSVNGGGVKGTAKTVTFLVIDDRSTHGCGCRMKTGEIAGNSSEGLATYPNPFSSQATVAFTAQSSEYVKVQVYDLTGSLVQTLFEGQVEAMEQMSLELNGTKLDNGFYIVRVTNDNKVLYQSKVALNK